CRQAAGKGYKIFIFGAKEQVNRAAVEKLRGIYPGISIVGRSNGYTLKEEVSELIEKINESNADILFLALGSPRQESFLEEHLPLLNVKLCQGIGGSLEVISGKRKRAPLLLQKTGFEWLYRHISNPKRFSNIKYLVLFTIKLLKVKLSKNRAVLL
ncbi:WecB/TagA/CpsF family glycosyltransferase, partial [bacterium]|nr:WecB/TagA/CpsF family glycosyltransferase [bacterium]